MRKFSTLALIIFALYSIFTQVGAAPAETSATDNSKGELVDIKANLVFPHKINDTLSVLCLVGDFAAQHNGAVITADSAVRYEDERLVCFGNVVINKNTTYAYCDEADYDSANNLASLYSPIVKVVDEDVTLYTYNFTFNTLENIGQYWDGGITKKLVEEEQIDKESREITSEAIYDVMESERGYYYADTKSVIGVEDVELSGDGYQMTSDSVIYEMEKERAIFFGKTNIWCRDGEYIYGDAGVYDKAQALYSVTENGYLLTDEQEVWGDSLEYYRDREEAILRKNIQIVDTTNKSLAFGDYAQYWGDIERVLLTRDPLVINYDTQNPEQPVDSIYLRGDTIEVISYANGTGPFATSRRGGGEQTEVIPEGLANMMAETTEQVPQVEESTTPATQNTDSLNVTNTADSLEEPIITDSLAKKIVTDTLPSKDDLREIEREKKEQARITAARAKAFRKLEERREKVSARMKSRQAKAKNIYSDSMLLLRLKAEIEAFKASDDSLNMADTMDSLNYIMPQDNTKTKEVKERDSLYRVVLAYGNVRSYRSDFQMVCDSLVANSYDTILNLYTAPIIWSDKNQITADQMDIYTLDGDLDYADFFGTPIMASQVIPGDTAYINQVAGKEMRALFENNNVTQNDVTGNVQTIYYMQDDVTHEVNTIAYIESGSATFKIKDQQLDGVIYRQNPTYTFAPLNRKPSSISFYLPNFKWEGALRPTKSSILNRTIRPSIREEKSDLERPNFPIQSKIDRDREKFQRRQMWEERNEGVSPDATEWMKSLGFTPGEPRKDNPF